MSGSALSKKLHKALGARIIRSQALPGGDIADVSLLELENHTYVVAKRPRMDQPDTTATEAMMLKYLAKNSALPVPKVLFQTRGMLVISYIPNSAQADSKQASENAAIHIAKLHQSTSNQFGFKENTCIGLLPQLNTFDNSWANFFKEQRLLAMARSCLNTGKIDQTFYDRIAQLSQKLCDLIPEEPKASLLHGDLWSGNMLFSQDKAVGFIDPAISYGHNEMDLAFIELMGGLSDHFFDAYQHAIPIDAGFHEERKFIYQLWPLLVHVRLFGGGYVQDVANILSKFGC